jgi:hypothetical protein
VVSKISQGNHTGIHSCVRKQATKVCLTAFILRSSLKNIQNTQKNQLEEPTKEKAWTQALELLEAIVDSISQMMVQMKTFLKWSSSETLSQTNHSIAQLCQRTSIQRKINSSPDSTGSPQSFNNGSPQSSSGGSPESSGTKADSETRSTTLVAPSSTSYWDSLEARGLFQPWP